MAHPLIKYTLTKQGRVPEWLCSDSRAFAGEHGTSANKAGYIPRYASPQDTIYLGMGCGDVDPDGTPDGYVGVITTKASLQAYLSEVGSAAGYKTLTNTVTGIQTSVITGGLEAWNPGEDYAGPGLTTTTTDKVTYSGIGTAVGVTTSTSTSTSTTTTDGVSTRTDTVTTTETTEFETTYDYAAEATRLWGIYEDINS